MGLKMVKPPKDLVLAYEKKREEQADSWYADYEKEIKLLERELKSEDVQRGSLEALSTKAIKKGLYTFVDKEKLEKGKREISAALLRGELDITRSDAYDLKAFLSAKIARGELKWPD